MVSLALTLTFVKFDLPSDVVDDLSELEIVEKLDVVDCLLAKLVSLFVAKYVSASTCCVLLRAARQMHIEQIFDL